ncbi:MAG: phytoene desaturase family protein [Verrucomicrobiales bacterium]
MNRQKRSVHIIGAGPGGLATAMLLAKSGIEVDIFERQDRVGGRTSSIEEDGFTFDVGPTFFMYPRILEEIFDACGYNLHREVELKRLDPQYQIRFESGGQINATPDLGRMAEEVGRISPRDAGQLGRFFEDNRRKFRAFAPILQTPFNGLRDVADPQLLKTVPLMRPWRSLDQDLHSHFEDPRIRLAFSFQSKYLGMSPFKCPSLFSILSFLEYEFGVFHPMGGCNALTKAMARIAQDLGVRIHLGEPVEEILMEGRRAVGVRTPSGAHRADALVVNADFAHAMKRLVPNHLRRRWTDAKIAKKKFSCSTFMLYLGVDGQYDLPHHTIHIAKDYERNLDEIENRHVLSENPSFYVQNACVTDPGLAPEGMSTLYALFPVSHQHGNIDWAAEGPRFREMAIRQLEKIGITDLERRIRFEKVLTPSTWESEQHIHLGATFNLAHTFGQMLHLRPRNRFEDLDSVYLVGGGTHPGSGLPVIFESARISSRLLLEDLGVIPDWYPEPRSEHAAASELSTTPAPIEVL